MRTAGFFEIMIGSLIFMAIVSAILILGPRIGSRNRYKKWNDYLEEDKAANTARRRDVEPEFFYTPDIDSLPINDDAEEKIKEKQEKVIRCAENTMVLFPEKRTNIELKKAYGVANLEKVVGYEENYQRYISALIEWAEALIEHNNSEDAAEILEKTVEMGSEFRKTYTHLADYYASKGNSQGLNYLMDKVAELFTDEGIKQRLLQYIMDKKEG